MTKVLRCSDLIADAEGGAARPRETRHPADSARGRTAD